MPCIILISGVDDDNNSEISLEDVLTEPSPPPRTSIFNFLATPDTLAVATSFHASEVDWPSSDSSVSWPSDEEGEDEKPHVGRQREEKHLQSTLPPMIASIKDLAFLDNGSDGQSCFKPQLACGGFRFWSEDGTEKNGLGPVIEATRDEEEHRFITNSEKDRE